MLYQEPPKPLTEMEELCREAQDRVDTILRGPSW